jgi:hypothetical protein
MKMMDKRATSTKESITAMTPPPGPHPSFLPNMSYSASTSMRLSPLNQLTSNSEPGLIHDEAAGLYNIQLLRQLAQFACLSLRNLDMANRTMVPLLIAQDTVS